jgi:2-keto-4-pentenoate hydratase/2-oxohepta-3-ene-1,7-dioic acid hydratase in catechol pathway
MRLVSFTHQGRTSWGAVEGDGIVDLGKRLPEFPRLLDLLRAEAQHRLPAAAKEPPDLALSGVTLLPPVIGGEKILCVGVNYANRNEEYRDGSELPKYPSLFYRAPDSLVGHGMPLVRPKVSEQLDYEGEIVLVIGRRAKHVPRERALDYVAGLSLANEGTVRDWVRHGKFNATQGKNFDRSGSLGPWMVTRETLDLDAPRRLVTRVNGETRQDDTTANMIFGFTYLISYISTFMTLKPGDLILSGTPTGAGARFDPPKWLKPGDVVEVEAEGIGLLRNGVVDEGAPGSA